MAISFLALAYRTPFRIRLLFSNALASGALATSFYNVTSLDSLGVSPEVGEVIAVPGSPNEVELALDQPLVGNAGYQLGVAAGVPATDLSTAGAATMEFRVPLAKGSPSAGVSAQDLTELVFGVDAVWDGKDMVETPDGDLETVTGPANAKAASMRRVIADGLPHDASYGGRLRASVDAIERLSIPTRLENELRNDNRIEAVRVELVEDENDGDVSFEATIDFLGGTQDTFSVPGGTA